MSNVYKTIADRMKDVADINIDEYVARYLHKSGSRRKSRKSHTSTLDGIEFFFKSPVESYQRKFIDALNDSKTSFGKPTFVSSQPKISSVKGLSGANDAGQSPKTFKAKSPFVAADAFESTNTPSEKPTFVVSHPKNFAVECSFAATVGQGFREIRYLPPQSRVNELLDDMRAAGLTSVDPLNLQWKLDSKVYQSLHLAINNGKCTIHIDEVGFVIGTDHGLIVTIDFGQHIINELIYKTFGKWLIGKAPVFSQFIIDHTEIITPHTANRFRSPGPFLENSLFVGFQAHASLINTQNAYVGASASIEYDISKKSWSGNVMGNVEFRHDWLGGGD